MTKLITCILVCCCIVPNWAQNGSYFLSHHSPTEENFDYVCFDMAQDHNGVMYFAMKAGVFEFDGREWGLIPGTGAVYGLNKNDSGEIFWVGAKGFGKIGLDKNGFKQIQFLSDSSVTDAFQTLAIKDQVYFITDNKIYHYENQKANAEVIVSGNSQTLFTGMFEIFGDLYVQTERNTTFKIENNKLVFINLNLSGNVIFSSRIDNVYVIGTSDSKVYSCEENMIMRPVPLQDQTYAEANVIVSGTWINRQLLALGTLRGGVMLVNPITGQRDQIIDYSTGLPDNEVFSLMADANKNIWVAHEYGFTQISPSIPFRSFNYYSGLEGNILCAYSFTNKVYVGTSLGLFKLYKEEIYDEIVSFANVEIQPGQASNDAAQTQSSATAKEAEVQEETTSKNRGFFNFLRRNRKKDNEGKSLKNNTGDRAKNKASDPPVKKFRKEKKIVKSLRSSQHVFRKVEGIDAKITHLVEADGKLIAAGLGGIFEINDFGAHSILHSPTRYMYASGKQHTLIASTYSEEVWSLQFKKGWQPLNLINSLGDQIDYIFEGAEDELWLCGLDRIYQLQLDSLGIKRLETIKLSNPNFGKTVGLYFKNQVVFVNSAGFYRFNRQKNQVIKIDSLPPPNQYFAFDENILYRDQHRWNLLGEATGDKNLELLNLFNNLRAITPDQNPQNLWMISGSNDLFKFNGEKITVIENQFPLFLKSINNNSVKTANFSEITINQTNSAVTFEVVQPDFINPRGTEFRYFLQGMNQEWSEWSSANNTINFPYLPPGEYSLQVQAKNIFGKISELKPVLFEVIPPYWRQSWFYAMEFIIFASLVVFSFRLSTRYRIISRLLSLITIILLIEFIQTVIGSSIISNDSPVIEFFIQVVVALLILPVEGFLRKLMMRSLDSSGKFNNFISLAESPKISAKKKSKADLNQTF